MNCITEILKIKGDKDFLHIMKDGVNVGVGIEGGGTYRDYEYLITFNEYGFRCGYVALPSNHPCNEFKGNYPDYDVHGGITFFDENHFSFYITGHPSPDKWIGFDAGYFFDGRDKETAIRYFPHIDGVDIEVMNILSKISSNKTFQYMEANCHHLIDQLIKDMDDTKND